MKWTLCILSCLPLILVSCSTYKEVSLCNFREYEVTSDQRADLHYVMKKHKLHYSDSNRRYQINNYGSDGTTYYDSQDLLIMDNIVIPAGSAGVCINSNDNTLLIDFGKGVVIPFLVSDEGNSATGEIEMEDRLYNLESNRRNARLYFDTKGLTKSKTR